MSENLITPEELQISRSATPIRIKLKNRIIEIENKIKSYLIDANISRYYNIQIKFSIDEEDENCTFNIKFIDDNKLYKFKDIVIHMKSLDIFYYDNPEIYNELYNNYKDSIIEWFNALDFFKDKYYKYE